MSWSCFVRTAEQCLVWGRREGLVVLVFKLVVLRGFLSIFFCAWENYSGQKWDFREKLGSDVFYAETSLTALTLERSGTPAVALLSHHTPMRCSLVWGKTPSWFSWAGPPKSPLGCSNRDPSNFLLSATGPHAAPLPSSRASHRPAASGSSSSPATCCYFGISTFSMSPCYPVAMQQGVGITLL